MNRVNTSKPLLICEGETDCASAIEAGYFYDDLYVEIIADGKHLPKALLKLIYKIKGADKVLLITDGTRGCGLKNGEEFMLGKKVGGTLSVIEDDVAKLPDRTSFAGSVSTFDRLIRTMHDVAGVSLVDISKMASKTPATLFGLKDRGTIEVGKRADLVLMNEDLYVDSVIFKGNLVE
jgi:N-acetylglucosamine-6-phosphate deacetylase